VESVTARSDRGAALRVMLDTVCAGEAVLFPEASPGYNPPRNRVGMVGRNPHFGGRSMFRHGCKVAVSVAAVYFFFASQTAQAGPTKEIVLKLHTIGEFHVSPAEKVVIIVERGGEVIGKKEFTQGEFKAGNKREITFNFAHAHDIQGMKVKIIKEGRKGWEFRINVEANRRLVYESKPGKIKFKGRVQDHVLLKDEVHEAWLDLRD
jgi:hypothetical protein